MKLTRKQKDTIVRLIEDALLIGGIVWVMWLCCGCASLCLRALGVA